MNKVDLKKGAYLHGLYAEINMIYFVFVNIGNNNFIKLFLAFLIQTSYF